MATRGSGVIVNLMGDSGRVGESRLLVTATARADERMKRMVAQYPLGRVGRADDVTPMVLLLASPRAGWITGQVVSVNGGYAML
jgi:NAD(P)-dependent dehydrogenase (short-subunit alcohol dehydrogenase family)